jgi:hypothetical protein
MIPSKDKQPSQIGIFQQFAVSLVTSLVPTKSLTALDMNISTFSFLMGSFVGLQYRNTRTRCTSRIDSRQ